MKTVLTNRQIRLGFKGIKIVLAKPKFLIIFVFLLFFILGILLWFFSFDIFLFVINSSVLSIYEKIGFFLESYLNIARYSTDPRAFLLIIFAILAALNVTLIFYIRSRGKIMDTRLTRGYWLGILGPGCAACGGSIIAPLFASLGAPLALGLSLWIGIGAQIVAVIFIFIATINLGMRINSVV